MDVARTRGNGRVLIALVRAYQLVRAGRPSPCRYLPSCSAYAIEALEVHGALRGGALAARRLLRCHPWARRYGLDPVPPPHRHRGSAPTSLTAAPPLSPDLCS